MVFTFKGNLQWRIRISIFGHDIFVGPWCNTPITINQTVPTTTETINLPDGFAGTLSDGPSGVSFGLSWEGIPVVSQTVPASGSLPIKVQPIKGVILSGVASVA